MSSPAPLYELIGLPSPEQARRLVQVLGLASRPLRETEDATEEQMAESA